MSVAAAPTAALPPQSWRQRYPSAARFLRRRLAVLAFGVILLLVLGVTFGPALYKFAPDAVDYDVLGDPQAPTSIHWAGTDYQGRDLFARMMIGGRVSLAVGIISMLINLVIGVGLGMLAGWIGGMFDQVIMRLVDALYSIPLLLIVILLQIFVQPVVQHTMDHIFHGQNAPMLISPDLISIYLALGLSNWLTMSRLARSEVINQAGRDYVAAGRALGIGNGRLLFRHILPNCMGPLLVAATLSIPEAIFIESFLAFIGLGVSAPQASWGTLASDAVASISNSPHLLLWPSMAISLTMLAFNLFGDGLRDTFDPSQTL